MPPVRAARRLALVLVAVCVATAGARSAAPPATTPAASVPGAIPDDLLRGLRWRSIGPYRGGRVVAVAGLRDQPYVYYFGGTGGGIWKTTDGGIRWANVSDGQLGTGSVGAVAVAESDPNVVYAGMGEGCIRGNVSHGDGVYRSTDGGRTWTHVGLRDTRQIGRIRVHPKDPDLVYVAALGHTFRPEHGARRLPLEGRRHDLAQGPLRRRQDRRHRPRHGPDQPARPVRRVLAGGAHALEPGERRARQRPLQDDGRRRHLEEDGGRGPAQGALGPRGRDRLAREPEPGVGPHRGGGRRRLSAATTRARPGSARTTSAGCASAPGTTPTSSRTRRTRTPCTSSTPASTARRTAAAPSTRSACRTATTTTSGSRPTTRCA